MAERDRSKARKQDLGFDHVFMPAKGGNPIVLLLLHGTGGDERDLIPLGQRLLPEAAILSPRGKVMENGLARYFRRLSEGVFDINDLVFRTEELVNFVKAAASEYGFDPKHVIAVGLSNGANIAASIFMLHPGFLTGAVLFRPMIPFKLGTVPRLEGTTILIEAGKNDMLVPSEQPEELASILRGAGADVTLVWQQSGHSLVEEDVSSASDWLKRNFDNAGR